MTDLFKTFADDLEEHTNKLRIDEAKLTLTQLARALDINMVTADIQREVTPEVNRKTIILKGRLGAMILTGEIKLVRDPELKDYLDKETDK
jgi:hypothetical protein